MKTVHSAKFRAVYIEGTYCSFEKKTAGTRLCVWLHLATLWFIVAYVYCLSYGLLHAIRPSCIIFVTDWGFKLKNNGVRV